MRIACLLVLTAASLWSQNRTDYVETFDRGAGAGPPTAIIRFRCSTALLICSGRGISIAIMLRRARAI